MRSAGEDTSMVTPGRSSPQRNLQLGGIMTCLTTVPEKDNIIFEIQWI